MYVSYLNSLAVNFAYCEAKKEKKRLPTVKRREREREFIFRLPYNVRIYKQNPSELSKLDSLTTPEKPAKPAARVRLPLSLSPPLLFFYYFLMPSYGCFSTTLRSS